jgi:hypothetical protein
MNFCFDILFTLKTDTHNGSVANETNKLEYTLNNVNSNVKQGTASWYIMSFCPDQDNKISHDVFT